MASRNTRMNARRTGPQPQVVPPGGVPMSIPMLGQKQEGPSQEEILQARVQQEVMSMARQTAAILAANYFGSLDEGEKADFEVLEGIGGYSRAVAIPILCGMGILQRAEDEEETEEPEDETAGGIVLGE